MYFKTNHAYRTWTFEKKTTKKIKCGTRRKCYVAFWVLFLTDSMRR